MIYAGDLASGVVMRPQPDQRAFVKAARAKLGLTPTELGDRLGKKNAYSAVNSWETTTAKNYRGLSFEDTVKILQLCDWLDMDEDARDAAGIPPDPLEEIGEGVEEILAIVRELRALRASPQRRPASGSKPKPG